MSDIQGIIFDLDHTLYDREASLRKYAAEYKNLYEVDIPLSQIEEHFIEGDKRLYNDDYTLAGLQNIHAYLDAVLPMPSLDEYHDFFNNYFGPCATPYPFTDDVLKQLKNKGLKFGLITNGNHGPRQEAKIDAAGIRGYFDDIIISGVVGLAKPQKQIYLLAASNLGLQPEHILFVGDNPRDDVVGPQTVGMTGVWIRQPRGWPDIDGQPDYVIEDIRGLLTLPVFGDK